MENKYYLAIETKPHNYFPINLGDLNIFKSTYTSLEGLDNLTIKYTEQEIKSAIRDANLLDITDNMPLIVIYYEKNDIRKTNALTKDKYYDLWGYLKNNIGDKTFLNKIYNFLNNKIDTDILKRLKESQNEEFLNLLKTLDYSIIRKLYFYLNDHA